LFTFRGEVIAVNHRRPRSDGTCRALSAVVRITGPFTSSNSLVVLQGLSWKPVRRLNQSSRMGLWLMHMEGGQCAGDSAQVKASQVIEQYRTDWAVNQLDNAC
jgi:hypothetical protein